MTGSGGFISTLRYILQKISEDRKDPSKYSGPHARFVLKENIEPFSSDLFRGLEISFIGAIAVISFILCVGLACHGLESSKPCPVLLALWFLILWWYAVRHLAHLLDDQNVAHCTSLLVINSSTVQTQSVNRASIASGAPFGFGFAKGAASDVSAKSAPAVLARWLNRVPHTRVLRGRVDFSYLVRCFLLC